MFMGARGYLSRRYSYSNGTVTAVPDHVISAYEKLVTRGLFAPRREEPSGSSELHPPLEGPSTGG
jgi:hypothetical protein